MTTQTNKASKVRWLVVGALLACAAGAPLAAALQMPASRPVPAAAPEVTLPEVVIVGEAHPAMRVTEGEGSAVIFAVRPLRKAAPRRLVCRGAFREIATGGSARDCSAL